MNILTVASFIPRKRIDLCIAACKMMSGSIVKPPNWWVVGEGPLKESLAKERPDSMDFFGYIPRIKATYEWADVFVLPSEDEGFGMVYIESVLCGTPFICAEDGGGAEIAEITGGGITVDTKGAIRAVASRIISAIPHAIAINVMNPTTQKMAKRLTDIDRIRGQWKTLEKDLTFNR